MHDLFDLELDRIIAEIKKRDAKIVLVQLPDGLKSKADEIVAVIETKTPAKALIWLGSCFGGCDIPMGLSAAKIDLLIAFGHNHYHKTSEGW